jgi:hypothetical protein
MGRMAILPALVLDPSVLLVHVMCKFADIDKIGKSRPMAPFYDRNDIIWFYG